MSSRRAAAQISGLLLHRRVFSTTTIALGGISRPPVNISHRNSVLQVRHCSSTQSCNITKEEKTAKLDSDNQGAGKAIVSSYWGVAPPKVTKEDGSPWRWNCFRGVFAIIAFFLLCVIAGFRWHVGRNWLRGFVPLVMGNIFHGVIAAAVDGGAGEAHFFSEN
ncbi:hypothetical protein RD792_008963 [Penstemon davidsonii]|uniref:Uncharacterized protein n=1 Tax=Penstemon davidsonii TaxID=160366 RepID=A0ABR0DAM1_9LAMI|nr:hypothetical protein RD792_008963 [Penstemon davidsonii]